jgi:hypothetical protein
MTVLSMIATVLVVHIPRSKSGKHHFYTLHSWIDMSFVILMILQWSIAMYGFNLNLNVFSSVRNVHKQVGMVFFSLSASAVVTGTMEK